MKIAWIGAGKMGLPICKRLKAAGHDVHVLARRPEQAKAMSDMGFANAANVRKRSFGRRSVVDLTITIVVDSVAGLHRRGVRLEAHDASAAVAAPSLTVSLIVAVPV